MYFIECNAKKRYNYIHGCRCILYNGTNWHIGIKVPASVKMIAYIIMQVR